MVVLDRIVSFVVALTGVEVVVDVLVVASSSFVVVLSMVTSVAVSSASLEFLVVVVDEGILAYTVSGKVVVTISGSSSTSSWDAGSCSSGAFRESLAELSTDLCHLRRRRRLLCS